MTVPVAAKASDQTVNRDIPVPLKSKIREFNLDLPFMLTSQLEKKGGCQGVDGPGVCHGARRGPVQVLSDDHSSVHKLSAASLSRGAE